MMDVYVLQYDEDGGGSRENWSVFYTPLEIFASKAERDQRISDIRAYDSKMEFQQTTVTIGSVGPLDWETDD